MNTSLLSLIHLNSTQCPTKHTALSTSLHHDKSKNPIHPLPSTINFHITEQCNYRCHFCYTKYTHRSCCVSRTDGYAIIRQIADQGVRRINFAGGEPTLHPWLGDYIQYAKQVGLFVSIISNGSRITPKFLQTGGKGLDPLSCTFSFRKGSQTVVSKSLRQMYEHLLLNMEALRQEREMKSEDRIREQWEILSQWTPTEQQLDIID